MCGVSRAHACSGHGVGKSSTCAIDNRGCVIFTKHMAAACKAQKQLCPWEGKYRRSPNRQPNCITKQQNPTSCQNSNSAIYPPNRRDDLWLAFCFHPSSMTSAFRQLCLVSSIITDQPIAISEIPNKQQIVWGWQFYISQAITYVDPNAVGPDPSLFKQLHNRLKKHVKHIVSNNLFFKIQFSNLKKYLKTIQKFPFVGY